MANIINAITTGLGGLSTTADTSGNVSIQSNGSTVASFTSTGLDVTGALTVNGAASGRSGSDYVNLTTGTTNVTLTAASNQVQIVSSDAEGYSITLPNATTLTKGAAYFCFYNTSPFPVAIKDAGGVTREFLSPNSSNSYLKLQENATSAGVWHIENPVNAGATTSAAYTNINSASNLSGDSIGNVIRVNDTQYIATSFQSGVGGAIYARLFTVNLSTKAVTWGNSVTLMTNAASVYTQNGQVYGDSNGVDRGIINVGQTITSGSPSIRLIGFAIVSGTLYISSVATPYTTAGSGASYRANATVQYAGSNNAFLIYGGETNNYLSAYVTGYVVGVSGTTVTLTQSTGSTTYAPVASNLYIFSPTSKTTLVLDTDIASNPKYISYNTSTNAITQGARTSQTTRIAGTLLQSTWDNSAGAGYFFTQGKNFILSTSTGGKIIVGKSAADITNAGAATVTVTAATYTYKSYPSKLYSTVSSNVGVTDYYAASASSYYIIDSYNADLSSTQYGKQNLLNCDPTNSNFNFNTASFSNGATNTVSDNHMIYITSTGQIVDFVYTAYAANGLAIKMNVIPYATPFVS